MPRTRHVVRVGSRKSQLALKQTNLVIDALQDNFPNLIFKIIKISTKGDKILDIALSKIGDKALFTKELEDALFSKEVDFIVHSLKDVPTALPDGLVLGCIFNRESPFDVALMSPKNRGKKLKDLPKNSVVGTSALRRVALLSRRYPHLTFSSVRGNLVTRLRKLDGLVHVEETATSDSQLDAIILAEAGVNRVGWQDRVDEVFDDGYYAVGQGALACECRERDLNILKLLSTIHEEGAALSTIAERALMRRLDGGCNTPIGVRTNLIPGGVAGRDTSLRSREISLSAVVLSLDGMRVAEADLSAIIPTVAPLTGQKRKGQPSRLPVDGEPLIKATRPDDWDSAPDLQQTDGNGLAAKRDITDPELSLELKPVSLMSDDANAEEQLLATTEAAVIMGVRVHPICSVARLRMARAQRLGVELANRLLAIGATEILQEIRSASATSIGGNTAGEISSENSNQKS